MKFTIAMTSIAALAFGQSDDYPLGRTEIHISWDHDAVADWTGEWVEAYLELTEEWEQLIDEVVADRDEDGEVDLNDYSDQARELIEKEL